MTSLKVGHMGGAKIHRNGNESTFRQTSMHHAGASNNKKFIHTCKNSCTPHKFHVQALSRHRANRPSTSASPTTIHIVGHTKYAYACPSNYTHLVGLSLRRDRDRWERACGVGEKKRFIGRGGEYRWSLPGPHQLSIKQSSFNYKKMRKVWAKWDGREEEHELARWEERGRRRHNGFFRGAATFVFLWNLKPWPISF